jgi:hypothetical protein
MEKEHFITDIEDLVFNPNEYTEKELLKLVYRELHKLREEFDTYRKGNTWQLDLAKQTERVVALEIDALLQKTLREQAEKRNQRLLAYLAFGFTVITVVLKFFVR